MNFPNKKRETNATLWTNVSEFCSQYNFTCCEHIVCELQYELWVNMFLNFCKYRVAVLFHWPIDGWKKTRFFIDAKTVEYKIGWMKNNKCCMNCQFLSSLFSISLVLLLLLLCMAIIIWTITGKFFGLSFPFTIWNYSTHSLIFWISTHQIKLMINQYWMEFPQNKNKK